MSASDPAPAAPIESVLFVTPRWTRNGGVGAHAIESAAALRERGVTVDVLSAASDVGEDEVILAPRLFDRSLSPSERVGAADGRRYDAVHFHQAEHPELAAHLRRRSPVLVSAHAYTACPSGLHYFSPGNECHRAHGPLCLANMLARGCTHGRRPTAFREMYERSGRGLATLREADLAIAYSSAVERHLAENGLERRALIPLFATVPTAGQERVSRGTVLFAGRLVAPKGAAVLIDAAAAGALRLVICGDGRDREALEARARERGVEARFTGWLGREQLAAETARADVVALPSLWPEPFGLAGIEALALGRPVVASDTGGVRDWLEDGLSGRLVPPGDARALADALRELLEDDRRADAMGAAGRDAVNAHFTRERHVDALLAAYAAAGDHWSQSDHDGA